ncbi:MAG: alpha/beta hydrolase-fold protein [Acidobacteriota bacterium]
MDLRSGAIRQSRTGCADGVSRRSRLYESRRRHPRAECDGQSDLSPRNSGDDRRLHQSGRTPEQPEPDAKEWGDRTVNRPTEYNSLDDRYARVITEELLPVLYKDYNISKDPEMHGIGGSSSGAIAAFTVAWERPNHFRKVLEQRRQFRQFARRPRVS